MILMQNLEEVLSLTSLENTVTSNCLGGWMGEWIMDQVEIGLTLAMIKIEIEST